MQKIYQTMISFLQILLVDTLNEVVKQHRKLECLMGAMSKGKVLGGKKQWTHEANDKAIKKTC